MLLGRVFRRGHFDSGVKLFSANTSLLETFSQIVGSSGHQGKLRWGWRDLDLF